MKTALKTREGKEGPGQVVECLYELKAFHLWGLASETIQSRRNELALLNQLLRRHLPSDQTSLGPGPIFGQG